MTSILCLACGGKCYLVGRDYRNFPVPIRCGACNGTGYQQVKS